MNSSDPTAVTTGSIISLDEELSVDEVAAVSNGSEHDGHGAYDATNGGVLVGTGEPTAAQPVAQLAIPTRLPIEPIPRPELPPIPIPPPILVKRAVSGRYLATVPGWQVELRVDVDGRRPMRVVSADYYAVSGATVNYFGSFIVNGPSISVTPTMVTITGVGTYTWSAGAPKVRITIPRVSRFFPPAAATLQHLTLTNAPGATYTCNFVASAFRTVELEEDTESGVTRFMTYNTGSLPSGGPARDLSTGAAYVEAGIQMGSTGVSNIINTAESGADTSWSNAELHAAMVRHFSLWRDTEQWRVWLFHAQRHDLGPGLLGIMFDQAGRQRQGAAVFYQSLAGNTADRLRSQLYTCVHELGHCFNLFHSFHKEFMQPPQPNRPGSLSWMNYPQRYAPGGGQPSGTNAFWAAFPFQFDDQELVHLRHAFRNNIIMGGNPFGVGAALEDPNGWANPIQDNSGLRLELSAAPSFAYGAPVAIHLTLRSSDERGKYVHTHLNPDYGFVEIGIRKPNGDVVVYRPMLHQCIADDTVVLDAQRPSIEDCAFIGYGYHGFYFEQLGFYQIRALYYAHDGSLVLSDVLTIRVRNPLSREDEAVAELFFGDEQGMLLYLVGGDHLEAGNQAFDRVLEQYGNHELAAFARVVKGVNQAREFKTIHPDGRVEVREPHSDEANRLLDPVMTLDSLNEASRGESRATRLESLGTAMADQHRPQQMADYLMARQAEITTEFGQ